jgi:hypothetical protein
MCHPDVPRGLPQEGRRFGGEAISDEEILPPSEELLGLPLELLGLPLMLKLHSAEPFGSLSQSDGER